MEKLKLAVYWATACGGCDVSILDTDFEILELANHADIVFWPIAVDSKTADVEAMPDGYIDICLFNGTIRSSENKHMAELLRRKSKTMVAFGACATTGGIHGFINSTSTKEIMNTVFLKNPSADNPGRIVPQTITDMPEGQLILPELFESVSQLDAVVPVDYYVPGCPPVFEKIFGIIDAIIAGKLPPRGAVLGAGDKALCETCPRIRSELKVEKFERPHLKHTDPVKCFLEQNIICCGPATRSGCGSKCIRSNMPCRGCYGPLPHSIDQGGAMIGALAALIKETDPQKIEQIADGIPDPMGTYYMFSLATSILKKVSR